MTHKDTDLTYLRDAAAYLHTGATNEALADKLDMIVTRLNGGASSVDSILTFVEAANRLRALGAQTDLTPPSEKGTDNPYPEDLGVG